MFAIVSISGKQYKVQVGDVVAVDSLDGKVGETVTFDSVLLTSKDGKTKVGKPSVKGAKVQAKILAQEKGEKVDVRRYKSKVRFRRARGFRAHLTRLEITSIG